jgi:hypothetical protein
LNDPKQPNAEAYQTAQPKESNDETDIVWIDFFEWSGENKEQTPEDVGAKPTGNSVVTAKE